MKGGIGHVGAKIEDKSGEIYLSEKPIPNSKIIGEGGTSARTRKQDGGKQSTVGIKSPPGLQNPKGKETEKGGNEMTFQKAKRFRGGNYRSSASGSQSPHDSRGWKIKTKEEKGRKEGKPGYDKKATSQDSLGKLRPQRQK